MVPLRSSRVAIIGIPTALEADELLVAARARVIARVQRAVVPFADQRRRVTGAAQRVRQRPLVKPQAIQTARFQRIDAAGAMRVTSRHQRRPRRRANRRRRIMLRQGEALRHQRVELRRARDLNR